MLGSCASGPTPEQRAQTEAAERSRKAEAFRAAVEREEKMREVLRRYRVGTTLITTFVRDKDFVGGWHTHRLQQSTTEDVAGRKGVMKMSLSVGTQLRPIADLVFEGEAGSDLVLRSLSLR